MYHIFDALGNRIVSDSRAEAEASFEEGKIVYEVHETIWSTPWISGNSAIHYEWHQLD
jgi:hypothetical protein